MCVLSHNFIGHAQLPSFLAPSSFREREWLQQEKAMVTQPVLPGMGSILSSDGVAFRVWAPHAQQVSVIGTFNDWDGAAHPMHPEDRGFWYAHVNGARIGDEYTYQLITSEGTFTAHRSLCP